MEKSTYYYVVNTAMCHSDHISTSDREWHMHRSYDKFDRAAWQVRLCNHDCADESLEYITVDEFMVHVSLGLIHDYPDAAKLNDTDYIIAVHNYRPK